MILNALYNQVSLVGKILNRPYQSGDLIDENGNWPYGNTRTCLLKWTVQKNLLGGVDTLVKGSIITPCSLL